MRNREEQRDPAELLPEEPAYHDRSAATAGREVTATGMQNMMASAPAAKGNVAFWRMRLETAALLENYELA